MANTFQELGKIIGDQETVICGANICLRKLIPADPESAEAVVRIKERIRSRRMKGCPYVFTTMAIPTLKIAH